jgi:DNA-binding transcriptional LysR family regulator
VVVPARLRANNGDVLLQAAIRGLGVVISPTFIAHEAIAAGQLVPLLREFELPPTVAFALFPSSRHVPARVRAFIEVLAARFGDQPWWDECLKDPAQ